MSTSARRITREKVYRFEAFRLDPRSGLSRLHNSGQSMPIVLGSRALEVLTALAERAGELVTKQTLMEAVWPGTVVEDANLTVQISSLRRVLDEGRASGSCVQTVIGRGYRFVPEVTQEADARSGNTPAVPEPVADPHSAEPQRQDLARPADRQGARSRTRRPLLAAVALILVCLGAGVLLGRHLIDRQTGGSAGKPPETAPRLSLVVLPFQNLSGNPVEDYLADGITDDLTSDLSHIPEAFVIARESAYTYRGKPTDVRQIGRELGVRYVVEGSVRKLGTTLRVNAQLVSAETGLQLWSDRFDEELKDLADGQQRVVARMWGGLGIGMVDIEIARGRRERPTNPDAFDLILQARALRNQQVTPQRQAEALALYERALLLEPDAVLAMAGAAFVLLDQWMSRGYWMSLESKERAEALTAQAVAIAPASQSVLRDQLWLYRAQGRWKEMTAAAQRMIELFPNSQTGYIALGNCRTYTGDAAEEIILNKKLLQLSPRSASLFNFYRRMGYASLMLGRDHDAIAFLEKSLALHPDLSATMRPGTFRLMAAANARMGEDDQARRALDEANRIWPFATVRGVSPENPASTIYAQQVRNYQDGLRRAGLRDHADEDADFGVPADAELRQDFAGLTPTTAPGARTIRTGDLVALLAERKPVVIDLLSYFWGTSIPGAVGLKEAGAGGSLFGPGQERLRRKMAALTGGDLSKPIVAVGWNSERFDGRNLALRLVAMGYTNVYWYRGGREAWEVAGLPVAELTAAEW
ncbi:MAG: adenylate cyclase [Acetobacteraceae bacterium]|nr:adenylate cyclase [Acetobacteraceae bacterium]